MDIVAVCVERVLANFLVYIFYVLGFPFVVKLMYVMLIMMYLMFVKSFIQDEKAMFAPPLPPDARPRHGRLLLLLPGECAGRWDKDKLSNDTAVDRIHLKAAVHLFLDTSNSVKEEC